MVAATSKQIEKKSKNIKEKSNQSKGGVRPGAGRKKGAPNKKTAEIQKAVEESGLTPLEYMLQVMRDPINEPKERLGAAVAAAPYVHAKLSSVELTGKDGGAVEITTIERRIVDPAK